MRAASLLRRPPRRKRKGAKDREKDDEKRRGDKDDDLEDEEEEEEDEEEDEEEESKKKKPGDIDHNDRRQAAKLLDRTGRLLARSRASRSLARESLRSPEKVTAAMRVFEKLGMSTSQSADALLSLARKPRESTRPDASALKMLKAMFPNDPVQRMRVAVKATLSARPEPESDYPIVGIEAIQSFNT